MTIALKSFRFHLRSSLKLPKFNKTLFLLILFKDEVFYILLAMNSERDYIIYINNDDKLKLLYIISNNDSISDRKTIGLEYILGISNKFDYKLGFKTEDASIR